nr:protein phosphatase 2C 57 [Ipomoea batatas]
MALLSPQIQKSLLTRLYSNYAYTIGTKKSIIVKGNGGRRRTGRCCSAIAIDSPASVSGVSGVRWGSSLLQGPREEMEDAAVIVQSDDLGGFSYAAVFDGHAGFSSARFLREELYRECVRALQGGLLLNGKDLNAISKALQDAFETVDAKLVNWLETSGQEIESGATATVIFVGKDTLFISHLGDSCVVLSRSGKAEALTNSHRPYGSNKVSLDEIRRIREAGGWIVNGRICGDISVSRAFGDMRFKNKKNEMLEKGVEEGRWSQKFASRVTFRGDLVTAFPDVSQVTLGSDAEFLVLASDGLWDYVNSSDAVNLVRNQLREHGDVQIACEALARMALDNWARYGSSIIMVHIGMTTFQQYTGQQQYIVYELKVNGTEQGFSIVTIFLESRIV